VVAQHANQQGMHFCRQARPAPAGQTAAQGGQYPDRRRGRVATITAHGLLPRVLAFATQRQRAVNEMTVPMIAGEGLEPPTLGL
jgi:hypothetical protein